MQVTIFPRRLEGTVTVPPSKSQAHRAVIAAGLASGKSIVAPLQPSEDISATIDCMEALGCKYDWKTGEMEGLCDKAAAGSRSGEKSDLPHLHCRESGSTLRFFIPIALALRGGGRFFGKGRLMERPQEPYFRLFEEKGIAYRKEGAALLVEGTLPGGIYRLPGDVSSQFVTGLLFALPLLGEDSEIVLESPLQSKDYVEMTLDILDRFGIVIHREGTDRFQIKGGQKYCPAQVQVEGDYSQAAFFAAAKALGNNVYTEGLSADSAQGDRVIFPILKELSSSGPKAVDVSQCPDLVPAIALYAALRCGEETRIENALRLRAKESDRLQAVAEGLNRLGGRVTEGADYLSIQGVNGFDGGTADGKNDHRIVMMLAIAATRARTPVTILDAQSVQKSYPDFWAVYQHLGGALKMED